MNPVQNPAGRALAALFTAAVRIRHSLYDRGLLPVRGLPVPVWSVGNLTVGGTGKTPVTTFLAAELRAIGKNPVILSRGYGRANENERLVVPLGSDPQTLDARRYGDEPVLLRRHLPETPIVLGANRYEAGRFACETFAPDVLLLDDGFQHRRLRRDVDFLVLDGAAPFGNGRLLPAGTLREPPERGRRADWHLVNLTAVGGRDTEGIPVEAAREREAAAHALDRAGFDRPRASFRYAIARGILPDGTEEDPLQWAANPVHAFSGIGNPRSFVSLLSARGFTSASSRPFRDHHRFTERELGELAAAARSDDARLLTTEKDWLRVPPDARRRFGLHALTIELSWTDGGDALRDWIRSEAKGEHLGRTS